MSDTEEEHAADLERVAGYGAGATAGDKRITPAVHETAVSFQWRAVVDVTSAFLHRSGEEESQRPQRPYRALEPCNAHDSPPAAAEPVSACCTAQYRTADRVIS